MIQAVDLSGRPVSLYVHVPFCGSRCSYCDFHSGTPHGDQMPAWLDAVERHLAGLEALHGFRYPETLYIGGGTPSFLPAPLLRRLLSGLMRGQEAGFAPVESTMEANPEDIDDDLLSMLADSGLDRISVGVQSLEDAARSRARRRGDSASAHVRLERLAARWGGRMSADLIYGLPGQSDDGLAGDVGTLAAMGFGHLSLYELTLSDGSPMAMAAARGEFAVPGEDERHDRYVAAADTLRSLGYRRYEVSNWCKPGQECAHNLRYWRMEDWLALGPSGAGNLGLSGGRFLRLENPADDASYNSDPLAACVQTVIDRGDAMFEVLMMALRTAEGLDAQAFKSRFGMEPAAVFGEALGRHPGLVTSREGRYVASDEGLDLLNVVLVDCLDALESSGDAD